MIRFKNWLIKKLGGFTKLEVLKITETYEECDKKVITKSVYGKSFIDYSTLKSSGMKEIEIEQKLKGEAIRSLANRLCAYIKFEHLNNPISMQKEMIAYIEIVEGK